MHGEIMSDKDDSMSVTPVDETLPDDELEEVTGGASAGVDIVHPGPPWDRDPSHGIK